MLHHVDAFSGFLMMTALAVIVTECVYALPQRRQRKTAPAVTYIRPGQSRLRALSRR
jgi:hypothetical protein